jgi:hypothetical protein
VRASFNHPYMTPAGRSFVGQEIGQYYSDHP